MQLHTLHLAAGAPCGWGLQAVSMCPALWGAFSEQCHCPSWHWDIHTHVQH